MYKRRYDFESHLIGNSFWEVEYYVNDGIDKINFTTRKCCRPEIFLYIHRKQVIQIGTKFDRFTYEP